MVNNYAYTSPRFGTRFPAMRGAYDEDLRRLAKECATEADWVLKEGVYLHINGPAYETPAATMGCYRAFGCDVIGTFCACSQTCGNFF